MADLLYTIKANTPRNRGQIILTKEEYWNSIYHQFRQWCDCGLFKLLLQLINDDGSNATLLEIDSTFCKVHAL